MADRERVVVKVGTNTLAGDDGRPDPDTLGRLATEIAGLRRAGHEVLVVSSGAIGAGMAEMGYQHGVQDVRLRQALAAVGQAHLMRAWERAFAEHDVTVAQLLLTHDSFTNRSSYLNLRNAVEQLLAMGVVPIVNENDTVSIDEIDATFGDNDRLSAYVAAKTEADLLVVLSDVAGLYTRPPGHPDAQLVQVVDEVTEEVMAMAADGAGSGRGRGGMRSKLEAARIATRAGITVVIADGATPGAVAAALAGEPVGTRFTARPLRSRKEHWLEIAKPTGRVHIDAGAATALRDGNHLLPVGVTRVEGHFPADAVVELVQDGTVVAKALSLLSSDDLERVRGARSEDARAALGTDGSVNVTRKGDVVVFDL